MACARCPTFCCPWVRQPCSPCWTPTTSGDHRS
jgi:hypothetical protein